MYYSRSGLTLGFHGTDLSVVNKVVKSTEPLQYEGKPYDWLGAGLYFWKNSPSRALNFAQEIKKYPQFHTSFKVEKPAVLGAVIDLGKCLDFTDYGNLQLLKKGYEIVKAIHKDIPLNSPENGNGDSLLRFRDCLVIETLHKEIFGINEYDSVRAVFWEGKPVYEGAGFREKNHIQLCIRNPNCIKGYFLPREGDSSHKEV